MTTLEIPLNKHLGIHRITQPDEFLLGMKAEDKLKNHVGTLHAGALFGLAEATSGEFLLHEFSEYKSEVIPLVRKAEIKYNKAASGEVKAKAMFLESDKANALFSLEEKNRAFIKVKVDIHNAQNQKVLHAIFDWYLVRHIHMQENTNNETY